MTDIKISRGGPSEGKKFHTDTGTPVRGRYIYFKELGSKKFMVLQRFKGRVNLHLRNYMLEEEEYVYIPTKRGVVLGKQQTRDLLCALPELKRVIKYVSFNFIFIKVSIKKNIHDIVIITLKKYY